MSLLATEGKYGDLEPRVRATFDGKRNKKISLFVGEVVHVPFQVEDAVGNGIEFRLPQSVLGIINAYVEANTIVIEGTKVGATMLTILAYSAEDQLSGNPYEDLPTGIQVLVQ